MIYILIVSVLSSEYPVPGYYGSFYYDFDGTSNQSVSFYWSSGFHISSDLNLWISNSVSHTITMIEQSTYSPPRGSLINIAGSINNPGYRDGDLSTSLLNTPRSIYVYNNKAYVADTWNHCIRVIDVQIKSIQQFAGQCTQSGFKDGPPEYNYLYKPDLVGVVNNTLFINDSGNYYIRMVNITSGYMTTLKGGACRDAVNVTGTFPSPEYDPTASVFYSKSVNLHTIVCDTSLILNQGEPSQEFFTSADIKEPCVLHYTLCVNRTQPYVIRQFMT